MSETLERGIVAVVNENPVVVLTDEKERNLFYDVLAAEARALVADVTTPKGRKAITAMKSKIIANKTALDDAGKRLNENARAQINAVDAVRRDIREKLDALAAEVRKPLTDWEAAEELRIKECEEAITCVKSLGIVSIDATSETVRDSINQVRSFDPTDPSWKEFGPSLRAARDASREALESALVRIEREEADRAELARLRAEVEARAEADRIAREEAEAKAEADWKEAVRIEVERMADERAEQVRKDAEAREQRRIEDARQEAANAAQREAERIAREAQAERDRVHEAELAAARKEADRLAKIERDRIAAEQQAEAARKAQDAEDARRAADRQHRGEIMKAAKNAIVASGCVSADQAKSIVLAIVAGEIPNVSMRF